MSRYDMICSDVLIVIKKNMDDFNFIQQYFVYEFVNLYISP